jgi:hypothetical protein
MNGNRDVFVLHRYFTVTSLGSERMSTDSTSERRNDMRARLTKILAGATALAALAFGGATLASAGGNAPPPAPPAPAQENTAGDADNLQQGDQATPDSAAGEQPGNDSDNVQQGDQATPDSAAGEQPDSTSESASETESSPGSDGPAGHADEPGNPSADHQFEGQE